jgi:hypothetical protein
MMRRIGLMLGLMAMTVLGADVTGTWKGSAETQAGTVERTFTFKVDGKKLTGETVSNIMGKSAIENGTVDGDTIAFDITAKFQDNELKVHYTGKVSGEEIKLHGEADGGISVDYSLKKVS